MPGVSGVEGAEGEVGMSGRTGLVLLFGGRGGSISGGALVTVIADEWQLEVVEEAAAARYCMEGEEDPWVEEGKGAADDVGRCC